MGCYANQPKDYDELSKFFNKALELYHKVDLSTKKHVNNWSLDGIEGLPDGGCLDLGKLVKKNNNKICFISKNILKITYSLNKKITKIK